MFKTVFCFANSFGISVRRSNSFINDTSVTLKDPSCVATSNATHYTLSTSFKECGSISKEVGEHIVISNEVILFDAVNGGITRGDKIVLPFSCKYKRSDLELSLEAFQPKINSTIHAQESKFETYEATPVKPW